MPPDQWYCSIDGEEYGPYTGAALKGLAREQRLHASDQVRKGDGGAWMPAGRLAGLFGPDPSTAADDDGSPGRLGAENPQLAAIKTVERCISRAERRERLGVQALSVLLWLSVAAAVLASFGLLLVPILLSTAIAHFAGEYFLRRIQAQGVTASRRQFPEVHRALHELCRRFGVSPVPPAIVLNSAELNAFALRFGRRKAVVLTSETLKGIIDRPAELRFILGHELGHVMLDFGPRRFLESYRPAAFSAAREMTCDNVGCAAAASLDDSKQALRRLAGGNALHDRLDEGELVAEAARLRSGFWGWMLRRYSTYPPIGTRIDNLNDFAASV